jgi:hypothetical protein
VSAASFFAKPSRDATHMPHEADTLYAEGARVALRCREVRRALEDARAGLAPLPIQASPVPVPHRPLEAAERAEIVRLRLDGEPIASIAATMHRRRDTVIAVLRAAGLPRRVPKAIKHRRAA